MSSQRVIQDSDDESADGCSDVATSIDPLQDPSLLYDASSASNDRAEHGAELIPASIPESTLPQVDFDRYLRSETPIMPGDYEDERWVSTADAAPSGAHQANREYQHQHQDNGFVYAVKNGYMVPDTLPSTASMERSELQQLEPAEATDEHEHPSKRRKISLTQDTLQGNLSGGTSGIGVSYDFFASIDPHGRPQAAIDVDLPRQAQEAVSQELVPERFETPPPTVPLSEDVLYDQDRAKNVPPPTTINEPEVGISCDQGPALETDNEVLGSKKKRGRPKKQALVDNTEEQVEFVSDETLAPVDQASKKKLGRPKKQDRDTSPDELAMDEMMKHHVDDVRGQKANSKSDNPRKKKVKRSKTTSDLPNTSSLQNTHRDVLWIDNSLVIDLENTESKPTDVDSTAVVSVPKEEISKKKKATGNDQSATNDTKAEPKKRGRKKKSTTEGPPAAYVESSSTVLQDISNTAHLSTIDQQTPHNDDQMEDTKPNEISEVEHPQKGVPHTETPMKSETTPAMADGDSPAAVKQAPAKPSPIPGTGKVPYRVGLSRRARITPLLKIVRK